jgi:hypothetical protein
MDEEPAESLPRAAPLAGGAVKGEPSGGRDRQPLGLAADPKARLIQVLDRDGLNPPGESVHESLKPPRAGAAHPGQGGRRELHPEQIGHQLDQPLRGDELIMEQIQDPGGDPRPVLHRGGDVLGEGRPGRLPALGAGAAVGAVLGDHQGLRRGEVEDLAGAVRRRRLRGQGRPAGRPLPRVMILDHVRLGRRTPGLPGVTALSAGLPARGLPPALRPSGRLLQPIAGRRLAAVSAGQPQLPLQLCHAGR